MPDNESTSLAELKSMITHLTNIQITEEQIKNIVKDSVADLTSRIVTIEANSSSNTEAIKDMKERITELQEENTALHARMDKTHDAVLDLSEIANHAEQYSRKCNINIYNLNPIPDKDEGMHDCRYLVGSMIAAELQIEIPPNDIVVAHRLPKPKGNKYKDSPAPMFVKFLRLEDKIRVMAACKEMNKSENKPTIKNDLTTDNRKLLRKIYLHQDFTSGWYYNGRIFSLTTDNYRIGPVGIHANLDDLFKDRKNIGTFIEPKADNRFDEDETALKRITYTRSSAGRGGSSKRGRSRIETRSSLSSSKGKY